MKPPKHQVPYQSSQALRYNLLIADDKLLEEELDSLAISLLARKYPLHVIAQNIFKVLLLSRDTILHKTTKASGPEALLQLPLHFL